MNFISGSFGRIVVWAAESPGPKSPISPPDLEKGGTAPGLDGLRELINWVAMYTLAGCLFAIIAGGLTIVVGGRLGFHRAGELGRFGIIGGLGVAFLVGISAALVNGAYGLGS